MAHGPCSLHAVEAVRDAVFVLLSRSQHLLTSANVMKSSGWEMEVSAMLLSKPERGN